MIGMRHRSSSPIDEKNGTFTVNALSHYIDLTDAISFGTGNSSVSHNEDNDGNSLRSLLTQTNIGVKNDKTFDKSLENQIYTLMDDSNLSNPSESLDLKSILAINKSNLKSCQESHFNPAQIRDEKLMKKNSEPRSTQYKKKSREKCESEENGRVSREISFNVGQTNITRTLSLSSSSLSLSKTSCSVSEERFTFETTEESKNLSKLIDQQKCSWEDWLIKKTLIDIKNLKLKTEENKQTVFEKKQLEEERHKKSLHVIQNREEWLQAKLYKQRKQKREKDAQKQFDRLKKQQEANLIDLKSKECYDKWHSKSVEKEKTTMRKERQEKRKAAEEIVKKKLKSENAYQVWLQNAKKREKVERYSYGYSGGCLFSYYDMTATPLPAFSNPLPWVDSVLNGFKNRNVKESYASPPMMWKDIEIREKKKYGKIKTLPIN